MFVFMFIFILFFMHIFSIYTYVYITHTHASAEISVASSNPIPNRCSSQPGFVIRASRSVTYVANKPRRTVADVLMLMTMTMINAF